MSKEMDETRAHLVECKKIEREITEYLKWLAEDLQKRGYMFAVVVGDKYGRCIQTTAFGPTNAYPRLIASAGESLSRILVEKALELEKRVKEIDPTWED